MIVIMQFASKKGFQPSNLWNNAPFSTVKQILYVYHVISHSTSS